MADTKTEMSHGRRGEHREQQQQRRKNNDSRENVNDDEILDDDGAVIDRGDTGGGNSERQAQLVPRDKVFKKSSSNSKLTLYLASRDLVVSGGKIDRLQGVLLVDPDYLQEKKVFGQITLTFRYGREDEEVMGLKFCNEAVMCLAQLYPPYAGTDRQEPNTPLQETLIKRLGANAHAFTMEVTPLAPPSVQLVPAKEYSGAPIGTSYDVRAYVAERADEKSHRRTMVRMGIRVVQRSLPPPLPLTTSHSIPTTIGPTLSASLKPQRTKPDAESTPEMMESDEPTPPHAAVEKPFLLSDGRVGLEARLDRAIYSHGHPIFVHVNVNNNSSKSVRRIKVFVVQHVDVCMFSNGKFKNVVALVSSQDGCPVGPGASLSTSYSLRPVKGSTKNWIALEDSYTKAGATLASTVISTSNSPEDRNVFAIYVSYYVKVKLLVSAMGGEVSLKLPFSLMHENTDPDLPTPPGILPSPIRDSQQAVRLPGLTEKCREDNCPNQQHRHKLPQDAREFRETSSDLIGEGTDDVVWAKTGRREQTIRQSVLGNENSKENIVQGGVDPIERCDDEEGT